MRRFTLPLPFRKLKPKTLCIGGGQLQRARADPVPGRGFCTETAPGDHLKPLRGGEVGLGNRPLRADAERRRQVRLATGMFPGTWTELFGRQHSCPSQLGVWVPESLLDNRACLCLCDCKIVRRFGACVLMFLKAPDLRRSMLSVFHETNPVRWTMNVTDTR
jgi:hypothetical protein